MKHVTFLLTVAMFILAVVGRGDAAIYQYVGENGEPVLVDDLGKVPEPFRTSARMVSGQVTTERTEDELQKDARTVILQQ